MTSECQWCRAKVSDDDGWFVKELSVCYGCAQGAAHRAYKDLETLPRVLSVLTQQGPNRDAIHARLMGAISFLREYETINNVWEYPKAKE